jgi:hypothetical protein
VIHDLPVIFFGYAIHLHRVRLVDEVEKRRKRIAEIETTTATVTDVVHAFEFLEQSLVVVKIVGPPVQRMTCGSLEAAFSLGH